MYTTFLFLHSWLRWLILILFLVVIFMSITALSRENAYTKQAKILASVLMGMLHLQIVIGLVIYFFYSPLTAAAFSNMKAAMKTPELRFWAVEHIVTMILGVVIAQVGSIKVKRASAAARKYKLQAIFYSIALVVILLRVPWHEAARLFRTF